MKRSSQYVVVSALREGTGISTVEDVMCLGDVSKKDAQDIVMVLQSDNYGRLIEAYKSPEACREIVSTMLESLHQGMDGWTDADKMSIEMFMSDLLLATEHN